LYKLASKETGVAIPARTARSFRETRFLHVKPCSAQFLVELCSQTTPVATKRFIDLAAEALWCWNKQHYLPPIWEQRKKSAPERPHLL
jgi:hypothetical protein